MHLRLKPYGWNHNDAALTANLSPIISELVNKKE
jgi:hypothetical protein